MGGVTDWEDELGVDCLEAGGVSRAVGAFAGTDMGGLVGCFAAFSCFSAADWVTRGKVGATGEMGTKGEEEADDVSLSLECSAGGVEHNEESERSMTGFGLRFFVVFAGTLPGWACTGGGGFSFLLEERTDGAAEAVPISETDSPTGAWTISPLRRTTWCVAFPDGFGNLVLNEVSLAAEADTTELGARETRLLGPASWWPMWLWAG